MPSAVAVPCWQLDFVIGAPLSVVGPSGDYYRFNQPIDMLIASKNGGTAPCEPEPCPTNPNIIASALECQQEPPPPAPCPLDASLSADDPGCTPCPFNDQLVAGSPDCVEPPAPCPQDASLTADDPGCVPCPTNPDVLSGSPECEPAGASSNQLQCPEGFQLDPATEVCAQVVPNPTTVPPAVPPTVAPTVPTDVEGGVLSAQPDGTLPFTGSSHRSLSGIAALTMFVGALLTVTTRRPQGAHYRN